MIRQVMLVLLKHFALCGDGSKMIILRSTGHFEGAASDALQGNQSIFALWHWYWSWLARCEVSHVLQSATRVQWGSRIKLECDIHRPKAGILPYCPPVSSSMAIEFIEHFPCSPMNFPCRWSHLGASPGGYFTVPSNFFKAGFSLWEVS